MKLGEGEELELDSIDLQILQTLQQDCKIPLARIGDLVGLSAPSVIERIKKLEHGGVIRG
jgi:DNA-binding Lrp family transcriptional regulator